jgi:hypothetical protein
MVLVVIWMQARYDAVVAMPDRHAWNYAGVETSDERIADYTRSLAWLTGFLVLASFGQGILVLRSERLIRESTHSAALAADAAQQTVREMKVNAHRELRPWVAIKPIDITSHSHGPYGLALSLEFGVVNIGKTPARDVVIACGTQELPIILRAGPNHARIDRSEATSCATMLPTDIAESKLHDVFTISDADIDRYMSPDIDVALYLFIEVTYGDAFSGAIHCTRRCYQLSWQVSSNGLRDIVGGQSSNYGNEAT